MNEKRIRVALIGAGGNTLSRHIPGFQSIEGVTIDSVCNRSEASSRRVANEFRIPKIHAKWEDVIDDPNCDAICIGTWPYLHAEISMAALKAGKHVLTEARMASDLKQAQEMLEVSRSHPSLVAQIVPSPFTLDFDSTIRDLLSRGVIGYLREIRIQHTHGGLLDPTIPMTWRQDSTVSGKNILTIGIYHEAVQRWIDCNPKKVYAQGKIFTKERRHWERDEVRLVDLPDQMIVTGEFENGILLNYQFSGVEQGSGSNLIELMGSLGKLSLNLASKKMKLIFGKNPEEKRIEIAPEHCRGWQVESDFINSIRKNEPVRLTSFSEGLRYMKLTEAIYSSWKDGIPKTII